MKFCIYGLILLSEKNIQFNSRRRVSIFILSSWICIISNHSVKTQNWKRIVPTKNAHKTRKHAVCSKREWKIIWLWMHIEICSCQLVLCCGHLSCSSGADWGSDFNIFSSLIMLVDRYNVSCSFHVWIHSVVYCGKFHSHCLPSELVTKVWLQWDFFF